MGFRWLILTLSPTLLFVSCSDAESNRAGSGGATPVATGGASGASEPNGGHGGSAGRGMEAAAGNDPGTSTCTHEASAELAMASLAPGFCAWNFATEVPGARGITVDAAGNTLVISKGNVIALWDADGDGTSASDERATIASAPGLNHGILLHGDYLYASSPTAVFRWSYSADRKPLAEPSTVVGGIPSGGHATRTLAANEEFLYVSVGSGSNVDSDSSRAKIRRFPLSSLGAGAVAFSQGEVFADGLRNEVGLRFDSRGRLWGVENGRDELVRSDLGGDIHEDNPGEELNLFAEPGRFYGYPYCFSEFSLDEDHGMGPDPVGGPKLHR